MRDWVCSLIYVIAQLGEVKMGAKGIQTLIKTDALQLGIIKITAPSCGLNYLIICVQEIEAQVVT